MPLEGLISLLDHIKSRIEQHGALLRRSEALTRYVLIDPLLRELGWDTEDPDKVRPEYRAAGGSADYALMQGDRAIALIEAKKLGESLAPGIEQALNYCNQQGVNYMIVTDGDQWVMYEVFRQAPIQDRKLMSFSVASDPEYKGALGALHLWQPNLGSGTPVIAAPQRIIPTMPTEPHVLAPLENAGATAPSTSTPTTTQSATGWTPIADVHPVSGAKAPSAVQFPDGVEKPIKYWKEVLFEVAQWLVRNGILTTQRCPIGLGHQRYIVNIQPRHSHGRDFIEARQLSNGLFIETNDAPARLVAQARFLIAQLDQDSTGVRIQLT